MYAQSEKAEENKSQAVANIKFSHDQVNQAAGFVDNRKSAFAQQKFQLMINNNSTAPVSKSVVQTKKINRDTLAGNMPDDDEDITYEVTDENTKVDLVEETLGIRKGWKYSVAVEQNSPSSTAEKAQLGALVVRGGGAHFGKSKLVMLDKIADNLRTRWNAIRNKKWDEDATDDVVIEGTLNLFNGLSDDEKKYLKAFLETLSTKINQVYLGGQNRNKKQWDIEGAAPSKNAFETNDLWWNSVMGNADYNESDPARLDITVNDNSNKKLEQKVQFGYEWNAYITNVKESGGAGVEYEGSIYNPTDMNEHGPADYSRSHVRDSGLSPIGILANRARTNDDLAREKKVDAITKVSAEGARWEVVRANALTIKNETEIYAETNESKFRHIKFKDLWQCWQKPFEQAYGISNEVLAEKLKGDLNAWKVSPTEVDEEEDVPLPKIKVT